MTTDPGANIPASDPSGRARSVSLDDLRSLGEAVNALRVAADGLSVAHSRFATIARGLGTATADTLTSARYDQALDASERTLRSMHDCWVRLASGLDAVADAYASGGPTRDPAGWGP